MSPMPDGGIPAEPECATRPLDSSLPVLGIHGRSNSGKTRLVEQLIAGLTRRGLRVGSVKHASHRPQLDVEGKDSWRHGQAGAQRVLLIGPDSATLFVHKQAPSELAPWMASFEGHVDVLIVEGFREVLAPAVRLEVSDVAGFQLTRDPTAQPARWLLRRPHIEGNWLDFPEDLVERLLDEAAAVVGWQKK